MSDHRKYSERKGRYAEWFALFYMILHGYRPLARRYKTPVGEIDLIMRRGKMTVFIEVKYRLHKKAALQSLTPAMMRRIHRAAEYYLMIHAERGDTADGQDLRFDLIAVNGRWRITHLDNIGQIPA